MARQYSTRDFFRQMPNALLARYFQKPGLFGDVDFATMKEGKPDELFAAWLTLPDKQRNEMDAEFRDIFEMSCEKGFRAIIDEANWQMRENQDALKTFIEKLSALFPVTRVTLGTARQFEVAGLAQGHWSNASRIRKIFREAFVSAGLPYFNPHSFRNTIVQLGQDVCRTPNSSKRGVRTSDMRKF